MTNIELEYIIDNSDTLSIHDAFLKIAELASEGWEYYNWCNHHDLISLLNYLVNKNHKTIQLFYIKPTSEYLIFTKEGK